MEEKVPTQLSVEERPLPGIKPTSAETGISEDSISAWHCGDVQYNILPSNLVQETNRPMSVRITSAILMCLYGCCFVTPALSQTLKVGITSKTLFFMPYDIGQKKGFY